MKYIQEIAFYKNRRDEVPNQELARKLAALEDHEGVKEIAEFLNHKNKSIASDCIKVLYEVGYVKPKLISNYATAFLEQLSSKNNRMVWGAMIALSTIAEINPKPIYHRIEDVLETIKCGSVITQVSGIRVLVGLAKTDSKVKNQLLPVLFEYLESCRPVDFATRAETMLSIITTSGDKEIFHRIIENKKPELSPAQLKKTEKVIKNQQS